MAMSEGRRRLRARASFRESHSRRVVKLATWPSACAPASVRAAPASRSSGSPQQVADLSLDRPLSGLDLPAREAGAVVLDDEPEGGQGPRCAPLGDAGRPGLPGAVSIGRSRRWTGYGAIDPQRPFWELRSSRARGGMPGADVAMPGRRSLERPDRLRASRWRRACRRARRPCHRSRRTASTTRVQSIRDEEFEGGAAHAGARPLAEPGASGHQRKPLGHRAERLAGRVDPGDSSDAIPPRTL